MLKNLFNSVENLIFPQFCIKCERFISDGEIFICKKCQEEFSKTNLNNWVGRLTCHNHLDFAFSLFWFDELLNQCIHRTKYNQSVNLLRKITICSSVELEPLLSNVSIDELIPVPLHHVKKRERGFNQSEVIAKEISRIFKIPVNTSLLKRSKWTSSQTKLNTQERNMNVENAFILKQKLTNTRLAIVDDVLTTGATTNECARILKNGGAKFVGAISLATPKIRLENSD